MLNLTNAVNSVKTFFSTTPVHLEAPLLQSGLTSDRQRIGDYLVLPVIGDQEQTLQGMSEVLVRRLKMGLDVSDLVVFDHIRPGGFRPHNLMLSDDGHLMMSLFPVVEHQDTWTFAPERVKIKVSKDLHLDRDLVVVTAK